MFLTLFPRLRAHILSRFLFGALGLMFGFSAVPVSAAVYNLPEPTQKIVAAAGSLPMLIGLKLDTNDPFHMEFIVKNKDAQPITQEEAAPLIEYFLTALTLPTSDLWVNLSPYEQKRVIPADLEPTAMGRDFLRDDYMLKQTVATMTDPESATGKKYWDAIHAKMLKEFGTTKLPVATYNKVWILPQEAQVKESGNIAVITGATLSVMTNQDYLAMKDNGIAAEKGQEAKDQKSKINAISSGVLKAVILPELVQRVNHDAGFARTRQIYNSFVLATWFKRKLKDSIFRYYINQQKTAGVEINNADFKEKIFNLYVEAFKKGVYNYSRREMDPGTNKSLRRQYYSGGDGTANGVNAEGQRIPGEQTVHTTTVTAAELPNAAPQGAEIQGVDVNVKPGTDPNATKKENAMRRPGYEAQEEASEARLVQGNMPALLKAAKAATQTRTVATSPTQQTNVLVVTCSMPASVASWHLSRSEAAAQGIDLRGAEGVAFISDALPQDVREEAEVHEGVHVADKNGVEGKGERYTDEMLAGAHQAAVTEQARQFGQSDNQGGVTTPWMTWEVNTLAEAAKGGDVQAAQRLANMQREAADNGAVRLASEEQMGRESVLGSYAIRNGRNITEMVATAQAMVRGTARHVGGIVFDEKALTFSTDGSFQFSLSPAQIKALSNQLAQANRVDYKINKCGEAFQRGSFFGVGAAAGITK